MRGSEPSDFELATAARRGNVGAFRTLVARYYQAACAIAWCHGAPLVASEDIATEIAIDVWRHICSKRPGRIGKRIRAAARHRAPAARAPASGIEWAARKPLASLDTASREALVLYLREGGALARVAQALGLAPDTAGSRVAAAYAALPPCSSPGLELVAAGRAPSCRIDEVVLFVRGQIAVRALDRGRAREPATRVMRRVA